MNERRKEEDLSTEDSAVVLEKEPNGREDMPMSDQAESTKKPDKSSRVTKEETNGREAEANPVALLPDDEIDDFQSRWNDIQTGFVDEPRSAVEDADILVAETMERLMKMFAEEREKLEEQWTLGDDVSTEHLRLTLQRYRSFFHRLLSL